MVTAKASLSTSLLHFVKGDDVWFSGWYLVPEGSSLPFTLTDLESLAKSGVPRLQVIVAWCSDMLGLRVAIRVSAHDRGAFPQCDDRLVVEAPIPPG